MADEDPQLPTDTIPIRLGEGFDAARLAEYLKGKLPGAEGPLVVQQFAGGHANLTYLLRFGTGPSAVEFVLRRPPLGPVAASAHDMGREYRALLGLHRGFPLAPRPFFYCDDPSVVGSPFFVMERRHGVVVRGVIPERFGGGRDPVANRKLAQVVIDTLAQFHSVDPASVGLGDLGKPAGFLGRQVAGWAERFERSKTADLPLADELARWLLDNLPPSPEPTLLHNDWRLDNLAVAQEDPGCCVAVYDWDMCTRGDPLADLGTLLALWSDPGEVPAGTNPMPTQSPGFLSRAGATTRYHEQTGRDVSTVPYYLVFGTFKMAVVLQQIFFRYQRGQTKDSRFAGLGSAAEGLFQLAAARRP
ncbi:MAG TPA: phosphotransferase family protein [Deltaproteobacteria bacterium]|jgi:aminoglycoside phosphotransferase (APT) family kinase protein|nr:phosphotransferase family protein [Deltaproteobacteria bacterium]